MENLQSDTNSEKRKRPKKYQILATAQCRPYFLVDIYNSLPKNIKGLLGTHEFKSELSSHFYSQCQHPYKKEKKSDENNSNTKNKANTCNKCMPTVSENFHRNLDIKRNVNKYLLSKKFDHCFSLKNESEVFDHRFQIFHHQAHSYRRLNNGRDLNTEKLISDFGLEIQYWNPIDGKGVRISNNELSTNKFLIRY